MCVGLSNMVNTTYHRHQEDAIHTQSLLQVDQLHTLISIRLQSYLVQQENDNEDDDACYIMEQVLCEFYDASSALV